MKIFSDERLAALGIISGTVSRHTGTARQVQNVAQFLEKLDIDPSKVYGLKQVHGTQIIQMLNNADISAYKKEPLHEADAWLLGAQDTGVLILTADCVPLFIWDDKGQYIGLAHCGWRGVVAGLPAKIAKALKDKAGPASALQAYIGPHINSCCFEVKEDVSSQFSQSSIIKRDGKIFVDLTNEVVLQLTKEGISAKDIKSACACCCTCCNREDFFSYRRDKTRDVLMSFVYKPAISK